MSDEQVIQPAETPVAPMEPKAPVATEDVVTLKANLDKIQRERDGLYARAKQAEEEAKNLKAQVPPKDSAQGPSVQEIVDLRLEGYSKDEINFIQRNAKPGQPLAEVAKDSFVSSAIDGMRSKAKVEQAVPVPSPRVPLKPGEKVQVKSFSDWKTERNRRG